MRGDDSACRRAGHSHLSAAHGPTVPGRDLNLLLDILRHFRNAGLQGIFCRLSFVARVGIDFFEVSEKEERNAPAQSNEDALARRGK